MNGIPKGYEEVPESEIPKGYEEVPQTPVQQDKLSQMLSNIPKSTVELGKGIVHPFTHPMQTFESIGRLIGDPEARESFKQFWINRYGGIENIKKTAVEDPVGMLFDLSTIFTGGGAALERAPGLIGKAGGAITRAGEITNPVTMGAKAIGSVAAPVTDWLGKRITESVFKLPVKTKLRQRETMTETLLEKGIMPSKGGHEKLKQAVTDLNVESSQLKAIATQINQPVPIDRLTSALDDFSSKISSDLPQTAKKIVDKYKDKFIKENKQSFTVSELDSLKTDLDRQLKPVFIGEMKINPAFRTSIIQDAKRALADRIRDLLDQEVPGLKNLNAEQSRLLKIEPYVQEAANRIHNWSALTLYDFLIAVGGIGYAHRPVESLAAAVTWRILRSPEMQQLAARGIINLPKLTSASAVGNVAIGSRSINLLSQKP